MSAFDVFVLMMLVVIFMNNKYESPLHRLITALALLLLAHIIHAVLWGVE